MRLLFFFGKGGGRGVHLKLDVQGEGDRKLLVVDSQGGGGS